MATPEREVFVLKSVAVVRNLSVGWIPVCNVHFTESRMFAGSNDTAYLGVHKKPMTFSIPYADVKEIGFTKVTAGTRYDRNTNPALYVKYVTRHWWNSTGKLGFIVGDEDRAKLREVFASLPELGGKFVGEK